MKTVVESFLNAGGLIRVARICLDGNFDTTKPVGKADSDSIVQKAPKNASYFRAYQVDESGREFGHSGLQAIMRRR